MTGFLLDENLPRVPSLHIESTIATHKLVNVYRDRIEAVK